jgi:hypothetical protein
VNIQQSCVLDIVFWFIFRLTGADGGKPRLKISASSSAG